MLTTYNFKSEPYDYECKESLKNLEILDRRNGILCRGPSCNFECYLNYIDLLNLNQNKWTNYGYLDLGMMPLAMAPDFMQPVIRDLMLQMCRVLGIPSYLMPPVSLLYNIVRVKEEDVWAFKDDVARVMRLSPQKVTLERFIKWAMLECKIV